MIPDEDINYLIKLRAEIVMEFHDEQKPEIREIWHETGKHPPIPVSFARRCLERWGHFNVSIDAIRVLLNAQRT